MAKKAPWQLEEEHEIKKEAIEVTEALYKLDEVGREYIDKVISANIPKGLILIALTRLLTNFINSQFKPELRRETLNLAIVSLKKEIEEWGKD